MLASIKTQVNQFQQWLLSELDKQVGIGQRIIWRVFRIAYALGKDIASGQLTLRAMSLVYTTILSVVPLLALTFFLLKAFNVQERVAPMLQQFFEPMGAKGMEIYQNVMQFVENMNVGLLGGIGLAMLLYTVLSLIHKIEEALNMIWFAPGPRSMVRRFSNYLSAVFLGPLVMMLAVSVTAATKNLEFIQFLIEMEPFGSVYLFLTKLIPYLTVIMGFFFFYLLIPNAKVRVSSAAVGAIVAGVAWQMMSLAFTAFVVSSTRYDAVYSGFAVGIVLMIWLYLNWLILLLGASIAFYFQKGNYVCQYKDAHASPELAEALALNIMMDVGKAYDEQSPPISQEMVESIPHVPGVMCRQIVDRLIASGLLLRVGEEGEQLGPARSTDKIMLEDIYRAVREDTFEMQKRLVLHDAVAANLKSAQQGLNAALEQKSLRSMIEGNTRHES